MKFTALIALNAAIAYADTNSLKDFLPIDGADFIDACDVDGGSGLSGDIDYTEFVNCLKSGAPTKHYNRIDRTVAREWSYLANSSNVIDEDAAKAMYYSFVCSSSDEDEQEHCAARTIHEWIDDIYDCDWHDSDNCTINVPAGPMEFIQDLIIADAFSWLDGDDDDALGDAEKDNFWFLRELSRYS